MRLGPIALCSLAALVAGAMRPAPGSPGSPFADPGERAWSVQMHVHGPFSEGPASVETATWEASRVGLDALWWSDHDWRLAYYHYIERYSFDAPDVPATEGEDWTARHASEADDDKGVVVLPTSWNFTESSVEFLPASLAFEGAGCMSVSGRSVAPAHDYAAVGLFSNRRRAKRALASGVVLELAVKTVERQLDALPVVRLAFSTHESSLGQPPYDNFWIEYEFGEDGPPRREGDVWFVPVASTTDLWERHRFDLLAEFTAAFPEVLPEDNSLFGVFFGVKSRAGARVEAWFDDLHLSLGSAGEPLMEAQRALLAEWERRVPGLAQHQGLEISYFEHLVEYSLEPRLVDYDALIDASGLADAQGWVEQLTLLRRFVAQETVRQVHARRGLVSYAHMFGTEDGEYATREELRDEMIETRAFGADLLEVGYRDRAGWLLPDYLWVWDELLRADLFLLGNGVSDAHGGGRPGNWVTKTNNFVSWVYAPSAGAADLLEGIRRGRVFFGDLIRFRGELDLSSARGHRMGHVVVSDRSHTEVELFASALDAGDEVRLVVNGALHSTEIATEGSFRTTHVLPLGTSGSDVIRFEVWSDAGVAKVFSNPLHFLREVPATGAPTPRLHLDLGGIRSTRLRAMTLDRARFLPGSGGGGALELAVTANDGRIVLDYSSTSVPSRVVLPAGLRGTWKLHAGILEFRGLEGSGTIRIEQ